MINFVKLLISIAFLILTACSNQELKQSQTEQPVLTDNQYSLDGVKLPGPDDVPPMTTIKAGKDLNLVRTMGGGACKNDQQGIEGLFLLYANKDDIERIKGSKGELIFSEFEKKIETFSLLAIQEAVQETDFTKNPLLDTNQEKQRILKQLAKHFRIAVENSINAFQEETSLTIDVAPFPSSFVLYTDDCEVREHAHPD